MVAQIVSQLTQNEFLTASAKQRRHWFRQIKFTNRACAWRNKVYKRRRGRFLTARLRKVWYQPVQRTGDISGRWKASFRTIETIGPVKGARTSVMPKPSLFVREQNPLLHR